VIGRHTYAILTSVVIYGIFMVRKIEIMVFWVVMPCSDEEEMQGFRRPAASIFRVKGVGLGSGHRYRTGNTRGGRILPRTMGSKSSTVPYQGH